MIEPLDDLIHKEIVATNITHESQANLLIAKMKINEKRILLVASEDNHILIDYDMFKEHTIDNLINSLIDKVNKKAENRINNFFKKVLNKEITKKDLEKFIMEVDGIKVNYGKKVSAKINNIEIDAYIFELIDFSIL